MVEADRSETRWFGPAVESVREVRAWLRELLPGWTSEGVVDDVMLCVAELATNAVLHAAGPYGVFVRGADEGVYVAVIDERPSLLPVIAPANGLAADILLTSSSGRGLQIVARLARRWGVSSSQHAKSVWFEVSPDAADQPVEPEFSIGYTPVEPIDSLRLRYLSLPVRAAVASGVQVDEILREIQLGGTELTGWQRERLRSLIEVSAPARLAGRHAALRAAGDGGLRFDLALEVTRGSLVATGQLGQLLAELTSEPSREIAPISDEVRAFRDWLTEETGEQLSGIPPRTCPLPD